MTAAGHDRDPQAGAGRGGVSHGDGVHGFWRVRGLGLAKGIAGAVREQTRKLRVGERQPIGLYIDNSGRLAGTMRVTEMAGRGSDAFVCSEWVEGEAWRRRPRDRSV